MNSGAENAPAPRIIQWLLDTRPLWRVAPQSSSRDEVQELKTVASRALSLLSIAEQESVLRYYHVKDAKMSLASHLLKHAVVTRYGAVCWAQSQISRDQHGKPCFVPADGAQSSVRVDFNVSHQAGIVSLIAAVGFGEQVDVGTDITCVDERRTQDYAHIDRDGFFDWVDMHSDVFAEAEVSHMKLGLLEAGLGIPSARLNGYANDAISRCQWRHGAVLIQGYRDCPSTVPIENQLIIDAKLRRFYSMWCLRETYVKMTGEALLAPWLRELEILGGEAPEASIMAAGLEEGGSAKEFRIFFKGKRVTDVTMQLTALGAHYIVGGAVRLPSSLPGAQVTLQSWQLLSLEDDVLAIAEVPSLR